MAEKIDVIIKRVGQVPYRTSISNTLENLQKHVNGYIEVVGIAGDAVIIVNEEGKIRGDIPYNCDLMGDHIFGTIIFAGIKKNGDFADYPTDFQAFKKRFRKLWQV